MDKVGVLSDLHRLRLSFQPITPGSSISDDLDYQYSVEPLHYPHPHPHPHYYPPTSGGPFFKSEYAGMTLRMSDLPPATAAESTKQEYPDDPTFEDCRTPARDGRIEMDQEEVDAIIRNKRKVRDPKACYACHRRKVKCDRNLPCDSCVKRDHPELCSYERPTKKRRIALSNALAHSDGGHSDGTETLVNSGPNLTVPKEQWERLNRELLQLRAQVSGAQDALADPHLADVESVPPDPLRRADDDHEGIHAPSNQMGTMHLGSRSVLAYMMGNRSKSTQDAARALLEENILPNLGLDNETATYPFVDLWSTDSSMQDVDGLCKALPEDALCREFWLAYRDVACTIYPVIAEKDVFENTLQHVLQRRAEASHARLKIDPHKPYGVSMPWIALLFAILGSGSQSTDRPAKERELTSQVYICCSYQALRMSNFLTHPCMETIQACLIIGNALSYNMNPGVSYVFLGMTLRSALSMGLHVNSQNFSEHENYLRCRLWWSLAWQDSHFSISYDRPSSSILCFPELAYTKDSVPGSRSYAESMMAVIKVTQDILRDRTLNPQAAMSWNAIQRYKDEVHRIWADAAPRLRESSLCGQMTDQLERLALKLHCSYMISEICRPALQEDVGHPRSHPYPIPTSNHLPTSDPRRRKSSLSSAQSPTSSPGDPALPAHLRAECIANLESTVAAYVELHGMNVFGARSWIGIQRSISAAFLLGILPETKQEPRVVRLLMDLEQCMAKRAMEDAGFPNDFDGLCSPIAQNSRRLSVVNGGHRPGMGETPNWARTMTKSLNALGKLNAALAGGKMAYSGPGPQYTNPGSMSAAHHIPQQPPNPPAMYSTPIMSPIGGPAPGNPGMGNIAPNGMAFPPQMNPYPPPPGFAMQAQPQGRPQHNMVGLKQEHLPQASANMLNGGLGPVTPDSTSSTGTGSDWNHANMTERALEYVQPGLWGLNDLVAPNEHARNGSGSRSG